jgi:Zn-finger domain-containing protein
MKIRIIIIVLDREVDWMQEYARKIRKRVVNVAENIYKLINNHDCKLVMRESTERSMSPAVIKR